MACLIAFKTMLGYGKVGYKEYRGTEALARVEPFAPSRDDWENLDVLIEFQAETHRGVEGHDDHLSLFGFDVRGKLIGVLVLEAFALESNEEAEQEVARIEVPHLKVIALHLKSPWRARLFRWGLVSTPYRVVKDFHQTQTLNANDDELVVEVPEYDFKLVLDLDTGSCIGNAGPDQKIVSYQLQSMRTTAAQKTSEE